MKLELDREGKLKQYLYIGASSVLFLTWCLSLAALTQSGRVDGRLAWTFGLCFLTVPMLIYQTLTPIWSRTTRYSDPHAHCAVDGLLVVFWFSAWTALASYVVDGKKAGAKDKSYGCENFGFGSATKCKISQADIVFGVLLMLVFIGTSWFSFKALLEYTRTGIAPGPGKVVKSDIGYPQSYKEDDEAFDSRLQVGGRDGGHSFEDTRVHGGQYRPYEGYASVPAAEEYGRPTSVVDRV